MYTPYCKTTPVSGLKVKLRLPSGFDIPALGFGTYQLKTDQVESAVGAAFRNGFRHFDCAPVYMNQREIGAALASLLKQSGTKREDLFVTSKLWCTDQRPEHVERALRRTLEELRLDYLDLYLMHWPVAWAHPANGEYKTRDDWFPTHNEAAKVDSSTRFQDTWKAMEGLVPLGLTRSIGVSNCNADALDSLSEVATLPCATNQIERHPGLPQDDLLAHHVRLGIVTSAYCPLGPPTRFTPSDFRGVFRHSFFDPLSEHTGFSPARICLNWALDTNTVVICRSADPVHIKDNSKAQKGALAEPLRWMINKFPDAVGPVRVMNPTTFTGVPGKPFFPS